MKLKDLVDEGFVIEVTDDIEKDERILYFKRKDAYNGAYRMRLPRRAYIELACGANEALENDICMRVWNEFYKQAPEVPI